MGLTVNLITAMGSARQPATVAHLLVQWQLIEGDIKGTPDDWTSTREGTGGEKERYAAREPVARGQQHSRTDLIC